MQKIWEAIVKILGYLKEVKIKKVGLMVTLS